MTKMRENAFGAFKFPKKSWGRSPRSPATAPPFNISWIRPCRINEFRGFLSRFSTNFHEILHTLFSIHVVTVLINILEVRPFDM